MGIDGRRLAEVFRRDRHPKAEAANSPRLPEPQPKQSHVSSSAPDPQAAPEAATKFISFSRVAHRLDVHPYSVFRWHKIGRLGQGPQRVKLRGLKVGGRWRTRWKWVREFLAALNEPGTMPELKTTGQQKREEAAIDAKVNAWVMPWKRL